MGYPKFMPLSLAAQYLGFSPKITKEVLKEADISPVPFNCLNRAYYSRHDLDRIAGIIQSKDAAHATDTLQAMRQAGRK